ncbi:MAG: AI-2E family transporter, partial [Clostridia bacterium]|nr:AI-2E family transporter [Clostridia bacterium]
ISVIAPIIYAFLIVLVLLPAVSFFESKFEILLKRKKNYRKKARVLAVLCTYIILFLVVGLVVWIVISQIARAYEFIANFADEYFPILNGLINDISENDGVIGEYLSALAKGLKDTANKWIKNVPDFAKAAAGVLGNTVTSISDIVIGIIISIYALFRRKKLKAVCRKLNAALFPQNAGAHVAKFLGDLYRNLGDFLSARAYNTVVLAVVLYIVLLIMGLEFYSLIALTVAICSFIPVVGIVVGGGIGTFVVLVTDTEKTIWFIAVLLVLAILDYAYLRPLITSKSVRVSLGTTIICVFLGFFAANLLGAVLALPLYVTVRNIIFHWNAKKKETV